MELSWVDKLRIAAVTALGVVVIGIAAWPLAAPQDPMLPVRAWSIGPWGTVLLLVLAFGVGFAGYFIAWPHGREIGILGVPLGLIVWAGRSGPMRTLTQAMNTPAERAALLLSLRFEPIYWLTVLAAGYAGVLVARQLRPTSTPAPGLAQIKGFFTPPAIVNVVIALTVTTLVTTFFVKVFVQDLIASYNMQYAQPKVGQIIFGVVTAFGLAGFITRKFLGLSYIWATVGTILILPFAAAVSYGPERIQEFAETRPATSYPHAVFAILPVQLVALAALGSIIGYWLAIRYDHWRRHQSAG